MSVTTFHTQAEFNMGHKPQRKRIRHRSRVGNSSSGEALGTSLAATQLRQTAASTHTDSSGTRESANIYPFSRFWQSGVQSTTSLYRSLEKRGLAEDAATRNVRVFGGSESEAGSSELCGPMLDVVLGLFGSIDYDEAM